MVFKDCKKNKGLALHLGKKGEGFTMLEMIIVIFVFLTGIIGVYSVIQSSYNSSIFSSNRLTALYLSQEGIELIKNLRDNNLISGADWKTNIIGGSACSAGVNCKIAYNDLSLTADPGNSFLKKNTTTGFYNYTIGLTSIFKRKITITSFSSPDYINISVETEWYKTNFSTKEGSVKIEDNLYGYWK